MKESIILIGGGGHCRSCIDVIERTGFFEICGIIDSKDRVGDNVLKYKIIGCDENLPELIKKYHNVLITIGQIKSSEKRIELFNEVKNNNAVLPSIVSPLSYVSGYVVIGEGTIVMHNSIVNAGVLIGKNCIINTSSVIEHDVEINDNCHISTGCIVNGSSLIGKNVFLGSGCVISNNIKISDNVVIGSGSVVVKDIIEPGIYVGVPVRKIK